MNNEPVAWAYIKDGEFWDAIHPDEHAKEEGSYDIPLYTHPHPDNLGLAESIIKQQALEIEQLKAKTLTDGEIRLLAEEHLFVNKKVNEIEGYNQFARAILKKASEK